MTPSNYTLNILRALVVLTSEVNVAGVKTPDGCRECEYRQEDWRDGGWCYMFKEAPSPTCAQFREIERRRA